MTVSELSASWTTSNVIHWTWIPDGAGDELATYELVIGTSEADVLTRSGSARLFGAAQNPELGFYQLPRTAGEDLVTATMTDGLEPNTLYHAQLAALDTSGRRSKSTLAAARTRVQPVSEVVIFSETATAGYSIPAEFTLAHGSGAHQGDAYYRWVVDCLGTDAVCFQNLRRQDFSIPLTEISLGQFASTAFYEFAVACAGESSFWSQGRLSFRKPDQPTSLWVYSGWTMRCDGAYRVHQLPLRVFSQEGLFMTHAELQQNLWEFAVGGAWSRGTEVRVDEVRIRW